MKLVPLQNPAHFLLNFPDFSIIFGGKENLKAELIDTRWLILGLYLSLPPSPGGFGFVEFENAQDADDAVKALDGTIINGGAIRTGISLVIRPP